MEIKQGDCPPTIYCPRWFMPCASGVCSFSYMKILLIYFTPSITIALFPIPIVQTKRDDPTGGCTCLLLGHLS
jgi:hypothetical protein